MSQYFDERPAASHDPDEVEVDVAGTKLTFTTDAGVFSRHRLDPGTAVLLKKAPPPPLRGTILDLGCGYGPIACAMAVQSPDAQVWAVDVNERARELTEKNLLANGLANVTVAAPDDVPPDLEFDAIFSNPPIRVGKAAMQEMLDRWLRRLTPSLVLEDPDFEDRHEGGRAYLVVQKHLGADSLHDWLRRRGYLTERIASSKGYRVFVVEGKVAEG